MFSTWGNGLWIWEFYTAEKPKFQLKSIEFEGSLADLYEDVYFELESETLE